MQSEKRYVKRIGWVVQHRKTKDDCWQISHAGDTSSIAIQRFNYDRQITYNERRVASLARCVPVYVEVQDG